MVALRAVTETPLRAIALVRVSAVMGRGDDLISPELQRSAIEAHAARRGATVVEWIEALDESASKSRSPWWARLDAAVATIESGNADMIIVWKLSRAARHRRRWAVALDRVEVAGGSLESATEGFDATTSTGRLSRGILAELAAWESEVKSEQWKETHARRYRMGLPHTQLHVFGYQWNRETGAYEQDPTAAPLIRRIFEDYACGAGGFMQQVRFLNDRGIRSSRGNLWSLSTLLRYMDSGWAAGYLPVGRAAGQLELRQGAQEPIITSELWAAYQARRTAMAKQPAQRRHPKSHLSGLVVCGRCKQLMVTYPYKNRDGSHQRAFRCSLFQKSRACKGVFINAAVIDGAIQAFLAPIAEDGSQRAAIAAASQIAEARHTDDISMLTRELDQLKQRNHRMMERLDSGVISDDDFRTWRLQRDIDVSRLESAINDVRSERELLRRRTSSGKDMADVLATYQRLADSAPADFAAWLATCIGRVEVLPQDPFDRRKPRVKIVPRWEPDS